MKNIKTIFISLLIILISSNILSVNAWRFQTLYTNHVKSIGILEEIKKDLDIISIDIPSYLVIILNICKENLNELLCPSQDGTSAKYLDLLLQLFYYLCELNKYLNGMGIVSKDINKLDITPYTFEQAYPILHQNLLGAINVSAFVNLFHYQTFRTQGSDERRYCIPANDEMVLRIKSLLHQIKISLRNPACYCLSTYSSSQSEVNDEGLYCEAAIKLEQISEQLNIYRKGPFISNKELFVVLRLISALRVCAKKLQNLKVNDVSSVNTTFCEFVNLNRQIKSARNLPNPYLYSYIKEILPNQVRVPESNSKNLDIKVNNLKSIAQYIIELKVQHLSEDISILIWKNSCKNLNKRLKVIISDLENYVSDILGLPTKVVFECGANGVTLDCLRGRLIHVSWMLKIYYRHLKRYKWTLPYKREPLELDLRYVADALNSLKELLRTTNKEEKSQYYMYLNINPDDLNGELIDVIHNLAKSL